MDSTSTQVLQHSTVYMLQELALLPDQPCSLQVFIPNRAAQAPLRLQLFLPSSYPGTAAPVAELAGQRLPDGERTGVLQHLQQLFRPGEVVLFSWIEWLREQEHLWVDEESEQQQPADEEEEEPAAGRAEPTPEVRILPSPGVWAALSGGPTTSAQLHSSPVDSGNSHAMQAVSDTQPGASSADMSEADIVHGEAFTERKSTFQVRCPLWQCGSWQQVSKQRLSAALPGSSCASRSLNLASHRLAIDRCPHAH